MVTDLATPAHSYDVSPEPEDPSLRPADYDGPFAEYVLAEDHAPATVHVARSPYMLRHGVRMRLPAEDETIRRLLEAGTIELAPPRPERVPVIDPNSRAYLDHDDVAPLVEKARSLGERADQAEAAARAEDEKATAAEDGLDDLRTAVVLEEATGADVERAEKTAAKHRGLAETARQEAAAVRRAQALVEGQVNEARTVVRHAEADVIEAEAADLYAEGASLATQVSAFVARAQHFSRRAQLLPRLVDAKTGQQLPRTDAPESQFVADVFVNRQLRGWLASVREQAERLDLEVPPGLPLSHQWPADVLEGDSPE